MTAVTFNVHFTEKLEEQPIPIPPELFEQIEIDLIGKSYLFREYDEQSEIFVEMPIASAKISVRMPGEKQFVKLVAEGNYEFQYGGAGCAYIPLQEALKL